MSLEINYFKLGETVFYRLEPYSVKTLTTINECDILYSLKSASRDDRIDVMVTHTDENLLSREEYLVKADKIKEDEIKHKNYVTMCRLIKRLNNIPEVEKERMFISITADGLNMRDPYITDWGTREFNPNDSLKSKYKSLIKDQDDDLGAGGLTMSPEARKAYRLYMNSMYGINSFEHPLIKKLSEEAAEEIVKQIKCEKEAKKMAERGKYVKVPKKADKKDENSGK